MDSGAYRLLDGLNNAQREAVLADTGPILVFAGAGSGKTSVLTRRIAYLIATERAAPEQICAVTFTAKAAGEMRARLKSLIDADVDDMWIGTFHAIGLRMLKERPEDAGIPANFTTWDRSRQFDHLRDVMESLEIPPRVMSVSEAAAAIGVHKATLRGPDDVPAAGDDRAAMVRQVYTAYEDHLRAAIAIDFDDMLRYPALMMAGGGEAAAHYQNRFSYLLTDEYQDTNPVQYRFLRALAAGHKNIFVVGDDDQAIYGWRQADATNILRFPDDFPGTRVITLDVNYRSTEVIVEAANAVVANNLVRAPKSMVAGSPGGEPIKVVECLDQDEEAAVAAEIARLHVAGGGAFRDLAILIRTNRQATAFEKALMRSRIPYRTAGGTTFYARPEVRAVLGMLRLVHDINDVDAFVACVNTPYRGLTRKDVQALLEMLRTEGLSLQEGLARIRWVSRIPFEVRTLATTADRAAESAGGPSDDAVRGALSPAQEGVLLSAMETIGLPPEDLGQAVRWLRATPAVRDRYRHAFERFVDVLPVMHRNAAAMAPAAIVDTMLFATGYGPAIGYVSGYERMEQGEAGDHEMTVFDPRLDAIERILTMADDYPEPGVASVERLLMRTVDEASTDDVDLGDDRMDAVTLLTVHQSKGLEFPVVIVGGCEEETFPHRLSLEEEGGIEEERRLFYVAMTRAEREIFLLYAQERPGSAGARQRSRFLPTDPFAPTWGGRPPGEIPAHLCREIEIPILTAVDLPSPPPAPVRGPSV